MDPIRKQARTARRRLVIERFLGFLPWTLTISLLVALVGIAYPKVFPLEVDPTVWVSSWLIGVSVIALLTNTSLTIFGGPTLADAAVEVDRRFDLRERLSSALMLNQTDQDSELGKALIQDANQRAEKLDVRDAFQWGVHSRLLFPILPLLLAAALWYVPDRQAAEPVAENQNEVTLNQVKNSTKPLLEEIKKKRQMAEKEGLNAAVDMFKKLEGELAKLQKDAKLDTKQQLAKLNDIKKQLDERRQELGSSDALRKNLQNLEKFDAGPVEKLADALKNGDFDKAEKSMEELLEKMKSGDMSQSDMQKMEQQLSKLQQAMSDAAQQHEDSKRQLQEQISKAQESGNLQKAAQLQRKLEQMQASDANMSQMQQMAQALSEAQKAMEGGNLQEAQQSLEQMASQLQQMNQSDSELQDLDELMDSLAQSKSQMTCKECGGMGCQSCMMGGMSGQIPGQGMGEGQGRGERPEAEDEVDFFDSQVRDQMKRGEIVYGGKVGGANKKGMAKSEVQDAVLTALSEEPEPLDETPLTKTLREHARSYFNSIRDGQ